MKKFLALLIVISILLSVLPATALATGGSEERETKAPANQDVFLSSVKGWPGYEDIFTTPAFTGRGDDFTTNDQMVQYLKSLLPQCENMYYFTMGNSPTYKLEMPLVVFTKTDLSGMTIEEAGAAVQANGKTTVLHQAQIHGNEPAAGEGSLALAGALSRGDLKDLEGGDILDTLNIMIIPRINPDGSYKFQRNNTANSINMNRDYLVVKSSEVEMVLRAYNAFLPDVAIDAHEWTPDKTSGTGVFDDLQLWAAGSLNNDSALLDTSIEMMEQVFVDAEEQGIRPYFYQGVMTFGAGSNSIGPWYYGLRGTLGFCVETRGIGIGWMNFERRVISQYFASESFIQYTAAHAQEIRSAVEGERRRIAQVGKEFDEADQLVLQHKSRSYGKAYSRPTISTYSNKVTNPNATATPTIYDVAGRSRTRPTAYVLQSGTTNLKTVLATLDKHNIRYIKLEESLTIPVQQYSGSGSSASLGSEKSVTFRAGSYVFPMDQEGGNVLAMLMEPDVNDTASPSEALSTFVQKKTLSASAIYRYIGSLSVFEPGFNVTFYGEDGTVLQNTLVKKGENAVYNSAEPTKTYTENSHYIFAGWVDAQGSPADLTNITADSNFYATFREEAHSYSSQPIKDSTCSEAGTLLYSCSGCDRTYTEDLSPLSHTTELRNVAEATCSTPGYTGDEVCTLCNATVQKGQVLPTLEHTPVTVPGKAPGCLDSGLSDGEICDVCGLTLVPQQATPRLGHSYDYTDLGDGTHKGSCIRCAKTTDTESHSFDESGHCTLCYCTSEPVIEESIRIYHTLDLQSDISIHYAVTADALQGYDSFYLECKLPQYISGSLTGYTTVTVEPVLRGNYHYFTLDGLVATQIGDEVIAKLFMKKGSESYCSAEDRYSIATYAYNQMEKDSSTDALKTLCAELLRYGSTIQTYKQYRTDALADRFMTPEQKDYLSDLTTVSFGNRNQVMEDLENPTVTWAGKALDLASKVCIRFIVDTTNYEGSIHELSLHLSYEDPTGEKVTAILTDPTLYKEGTSYYAFAFSGLPASELRAELTATVYSGEMQVSPTLEYAADSYGNGKTGILKDVCAALFAYSDASKAYFLSLN